jgi:predicted metal-dependent HD superfamily phosphohydrolase
MTNTLQSRWQNLVAHYTAKDSLEEFNQLVAHYSEPQRFYHTLEHLQNIFLTFDILNLDLAKEDTAILEFAVWFHDIIYDAKAKDNEDQSAARASLMLESFKIPKSIVLPTCQLILDTKRHQPSTESFVNLLFLDLDLSIFGASPALYDRYTHNIRKEYACVEEKAYREGRAKVLQNFLQRPKIFFTALMHTKFDRTARQNLEGEIAWLNKI